MKIAVLIGVFTIIRHCAAGKLFFHIACFYFLAVTGNRFTYLAPLTHI